MKAIRILGIIFVILMLLPLAVVDKLDKAQEYKKYGDFYLDQGELESAVLQYKIALIYGEDYWQAHKALGITYCRLGDYPRARASLSRAYELNGKQADLKNVLEHVTRLLPENEPDSFLVGKVVIDKSNYVLKLYDRSGVVRRMYHVAVGRNPDGSNKERIGDRRTPEGEFIITHKNYFKKGSWQRRIYGPYYFGLQSKKWGGFGIHGTYKKSSIGTKASLGCIRLFAKDVIDLRKYIDVGTRVTIVN